METHNLVAATPGRSGFPGHLIRERNICMSFIYFTLEVIRITYAHFIVALVTSPPTPKNYKDLKCRGEDGMFNVYCVSGVVMILVNFVSHVSIVCDLF